MMKYLIVLIFALFALSSVQAASNLECEFCDFVVGYAEKYVESNATESEIIGEMEKVCKFVPQSLQATCDSLVGVYGDEIIQMLINKESASTICAQVKLCPAPAVKQVGGALECTICDYFVEQIEKYLSGNATETQIVKFLDADCKLFAGFEATCQSLVQTYVPTLITLIENNESPNTVCAQIQLCGGSSEIVIEEVKGNAVECTICTILVQEVETFVQNNQTESEIVAALNQECNLLPGKPIQQICTGIVSQYADPIINYVIAKESATTICNQIELCGSNSSSENNGSSSENNGSSSESYSSESYSSESSGSQSSQSQASGSYSGSGSMTGASSGSMSGTSGSMKIHIQ